MKPRRWKRLLLYSGMGIIILLLFLFFARPLYLPDSHLIHRLQQAVSAATGLQIEIEKGRFSLLQHALLENVTIRDANGKLIASCKELRVNYRPLPLLQKHLQFEELVLIDPVIYVHAEKRSSGSITQPSPSDSGPETAAVEPLSADVSSGSPLNFVLPVAIQIDKLHVRNARLELRKKSPDVSWEIDLGGVNLSGEEIYVQDQDNSHLQMEIDLDDSLRLICSTASLSYKIQTDLVFSADATAERERSTLDFELEAHPSLQISSRNVTIPEISLSAESVLDNLEDLAVSKMSLSLGGVLGVVLTAALDGVFETPALQAYLSAGRVDIEPALSLLANLSALESLAVPQIKGNLIIGESQFYVNRSHPDLEIGGTLRCRLQDGYFHDPGRRLELYNLNFDSFAEGRILPPHRLSGDVGIDLQADRLTISHSLQEAPLTFSPISLGISAKVFPELTSPELSVVWQGGAPFGAGFRGSLFTSADSLDLLKPHLSRGLYLESGFSVDDLDLHELVEEDVRGTLSLAADLRMQSFDDVVLTIGVLCPDLSFEYTGSTLVLPPLMSRLNVQGSASTAFDGFHASRLHLDMSPYCEIDLSASLFEKQRWEVTSADLMLNLSEITPVLKPLFPQSLENLDVSGTITVNGSSQGQLNAPHDRHTVLRISSDDLSMVFPRQKIEIDSIRLQAETQIDERALTIRSSADIGRLTIAKGVAGSYRDIALSARGRLRNFRELAFASAELASERLGLNIHLDAESDASKSPRLNAINLRYRLNPTDSIIILSDVTISGASEGKCRIALSSDSVHQVDGMVTGEELNLSFGDQIDLSGLTFRLPFTSTLVNGKSGITLPSRGNGFSPDDDPVIFSSFEHLAAQERDLGEVRCRKIRAGDYVIENLEGIVGFNQGELEMPKLRLDGYGGTIQGALEMDVPSFDPDSVEYWIKVSGIGLNSARLPGVESGAGEESKISAFAYLEGAGLNPASRFELQGGLDITQIGRGVADNILRFLDPDQDDPSIRTYRNYIKRGWGVKVFSFDVKEDFVYVSITPARPPLSQLDMFLLSHIVSLGRSVTFGRLPLRYFLDGRARQDPR